MNKQNTILNTIMAQKQTRIMYDSGYEKERVMGSQKIQDYVVKPPMATMEYPMEALTEPEQTRLSQSNIDGKGMTVNRFEDLHSNPQDWNKISAPFVHGTNSRLLAKDNHRPCLPMPMNMKPLEPPKEMKVGNPTVTTSFGCYPTQSVLTAPVTPSQAARLYRKTGASSKYYLEHQSGARIPYPYVSEYGKDRNLGKLQ